MFCFFLCLSVCPLVFLLFNESVRLRFPLITAHHCYFYCCYYYHYGQRFYYTTITTAMVMLLHISFLFTTTACAAFPVYIWHVTHFRSQLLSLTGSDDVFGVLLSSVTAAGAMHISHAVHRVIWRQHAEPSRSRDKGRNALQRLAGFGSCCC